MQSLAVHAVCDLDSDNMRSIRGPRPHSTPDPVRVLACNGVSRNPQSLQNALGRAGIYVECHPRVHEQEARFLAAADCWDAFIICEWQFPSDLEVFLEQFASQLPPVVVVTDVPNDQRAVALLKAGAQDYLRRETLIPARLSAAIIEAVARGRARRESSKRLHDAIQMALTDPLTGLWNRRYFDHHFPRAIDGVSRHHLPLSLILADMDHFKAINDQLGHASGDEFLRIAAQTTLALLRSSDWVARYGGDEMVAVLPCTPLAGAVEVANRIACAVKKTNATIHDATLSTSVSIGVASTECFQDLPDAAALFAAADGALRAAKAAGPGSVSASRATEA